ncbi:MAG: DUF1428 domain-containing protein [Novosphingobium sp.]|nr:DUF1428 domain-containing protein [Novosphingobium sp.]
MADRRGEGGCADAAYPSRSRIRADLIAAGALRVVECWGDAVAHGKVTDFYRAIAAQEGETAVFSWIEWPSKAARDAGIARIESEPDPAGEPGHPAPFDGKRIVFGGFVPLFDLTVPAS